MRRRFGLAMLFAGAAFVATATALALSMGSFTVGCMSEDDTTIPCFSMMHPDRIGAAFFSVGGGVKVVQRPSGYVLSSSVHFFALSRPYTSSSFATAACTGHALGQLHHADADHPHAGDAPHASVQLLPLLGARRDDHVGRVRLSHFFRAGNRLDVGGSEERAGLLLGGEAGPDDGAEQAQNGTQVGTRMREAPRRRMTNTVGRPACREGMPR